MMNTVWTIDHRYGDAAIANNIIRVLKGYIEDPENFNIENFPNYSDYQKPGSDKTKAL